MLNTISIPWRAARTRAALRAALTALGRGIGFLEWEKIGKPRKSGKSGTEKTRKPSLKLRAWKPERP